MSRNTSTRNFFAAIILAVSYEPAFSHVGVGPAYSFTAGLVHPLFGLGHIIVMVAIGLLAAIKGERALWAWPAAFVGLMLVGAVLGIAGVPIPLVEYVILGSIVAVGLVAAAAADLPVVTGTLVIGVFAIFHGHAHGTETPWAAGYLEYFTGLALATAFLHGIGIGLGLLLSGRLRSLVQLAGATTAAVGLGLMVGIL
ncbi:HupE/UreJ family protein [Ensifer sp. BR816]|uniref:HupE/UreJ family protein n=1 Tax=Rhizobium sp. (strain BR816) TaxID=1057002 RepID=UPI00037922D7|nr:HupE/UreJ family protein [Ensifer sp. BR816]